MAGDDAPVEDPYAPGELPVLRYAEEILQAVRTNPTTVVIGETGSGKTTQISQILHRASATLMPDSRMGVAITQPRRVAAVSVARRVAHEMGVKIGTLVGYTVRFEDCSSRETRIKYMTDGTLLRECLEDPNLSKYGVIVLDEAHERSLNTDILFGLLKVLVKTRQPALRLVVTSATLESEKFSAYFNDCPVYHVPGRVYPVELAYATEQPKNYAETALETVMDLHCSQGRGDILLFLTGKEEIERTCRRLNERVREMPEDECPDMQVLPLYAALSPELQARVFAPPPAGCRRVVVATNLAETSLTVPGVVFVVDPGFTKQNEYDPATGMDSLKVTSISAVQARQRAGRAGRTRAGRCFRLYTREHFELDMPTTTVPEIQRTSLVGTVLYLKTLRIEGLDVLDFDFLDKPDVEAMGDALRQLYALGAIDEDGAVTDLGREMSPLPVEPQLARAMLAARRFGCVDEMATVAAMLSVERVYTGNGPPREGGGRRRRPPGAPPESLCSEHERRMGDHVVLMRTYQAWARGGHRRDFCERHGLSDRGMEFARDVRKQLLGVFREMERRATKEGDKGGVKHGARREEDEEETNQRGQSRSRDTGTGVAAETGAGTGVAAETGAGTGVAAETGAGTGVAAETGAGTGAGTGTEAGVATGTEAGAGAGMTRPSAGTSPPFVRPSASASATASPDASPSTTASAPSTTTRCSPRYTRRPLVRSRTKSPACCPSGSCTTSWWRRRACFCATSARSRLRGWARSRNGSGKST